MTRRWRDVHLTDGTIVVPVRRSVTPGTDPEEFDFEVIPSDDGDVREVDQGNLPGRRLCRSRRLASDRLWNLRLIEGHKVTIFRGLDHRA